MAFLRLECFGHYLEFGRTEPAEEDEAEAIPAPEGTQFPLQLFTQPPGFRVIGDDGVIITDT